MKIAVNKFYYNFAQNTLKTTYNLMINEYFTYKKINLEGKEEIIIKDRIPTLAQFRYWFNKERNIKKKLVIDLVIGYTNKNIDQF